MEKSCVFCGKKPHEKNKEHIIPKWLIKLTGNPNRIFYLGTPWLHNSSGRNYSANQFQFPACKECNDRFSELEESSRNTINKILSCSKITTREIDLILNWFDKIRVGLWLGYRYLENNYFGIDPHFYINSRIGRADRALFIYCLNYNLRGLSFGGVTSPVFFHMPSCFYLRIKNLLFINLSRDFLISRRVGFPYPHRIISRNTDGTYIAKMCKPFERIIRPIINHPFREPEYALFQPIIPITESNKNIIFENEYLQNHMLFVESGKGKIIFGNNNDHLWLSDGDEIEIVGDNSSISQEKSFDIMKIITIQTHEYQLKLFEQRDNINAEIINATNETKKATKRKFQQMKTIQKILTNNTRMVPSHKMFKSKEDSEE